MIPLSLSLSGFLSYREPVELDFTTFDLACIAGPNGAGKSSLLDAITWSLFGQARKRDESLIHTLCDLAEVAFTFQYEGAVYRVQRTNARGKSTALEFHLQTPEGDWKALTERTLRETDSRIQGILRLDYDTFVNASFFLQGKADQFTQQRPGDRKRILSSILGLEIWETYRQRAAERRRDVQGQIEKLDGRLQEIENELAEEESRLSYLQSLESELETLAAARSAQEAHLESLRQIAATLAEQERLVQTLARQVESGARTLEEMESRRLDRAGERELHSERLAQAEEIEKAHAAWQAARAELDHWSEVSQRYREHELRREEPLRLIAEERARLETEEAALMAQQSALDEELSHRSDLKSRLKEAQAALDAAQEQTARRDDLDVALQSARQRFAEARAENPRLREEMEQLKERIDQLREVEGATCPVCGQPLSPEDRQTMMAGLTEEGMERGDRYRENKSLLDSSEEQVQSLEKQLQELADAGKQLMAHTRQVDQINASLEALQGKEAAWQETAAPRLAEVRGALESQAFAAQARATLAEVDGELKAIGYDAARHDQVRGAAAQGASAEEGMRSLEQARAALAPLEREIESLDEQIEAQTQAVNQSREEHEQAAARLEQAQAQAPDVETAERELLAMQQQENRLHMEVGAARQKVEVLEDLKDRRQGLSEERASQARQVGLYKQLERAFGKDGVPALLIEQALPQIETQANQILDRLSNGSMSVRFVTQTEYKDRRRSDLRETLDIQIRDSAGMRDYEMYSGGEAFRVNFAIRLALSGVLAQRAGARLQTLVIDEGFGSQDAAGRQRLIEAINMVRPDFAKILVITHIDELKDAFPVRIEVEKTPAGSQVEVV
jgi:exonuclease SbcC